MKVKLDIHTSLLSSEIMYACSLQEGTKKVTYITHRFDNAMRLPSLIALSKFTIHVHNPFTTLTSYKSA